MKREIGLVTAGILVGAMIASPAAGAVSDLLTAQRVSYPVYVDGRSVDLEAYAIDGHTYVQLRELGREVGFNVYWQDNAAQVQSGMTYTGEAPPAMDYAAQANPSIFNSTYTREVYNALRSATLTGTGEVKDATEGTKTVTEGVAAAVGCYPAYDVSGIKIADHAIKVTVRYPAPYEEGAQVCKMFLATLTGSDRDKLTAMAAYICDRLEYDAASTTTPANLFTEPGVHKGACMSYALVFKFLCDLEGIPCVFVHSDNHQWNEVYADGAWYAVDLANYDSSYTRGTPGTLLTDPATLQWNPYRQIEPDLTRFAKEVLVPGSTK